MTAQRGLHKKSTCTREQHNNDNPLSLCKASSDPLCLSDLTAQSIAAHYKREKPHVCPCDFTKSRGFMWFWFRESIWKSTNHRKCWWRIFYKRYLYPVLFLGSSSVYHGNSVLSSDKKGFLFPKKPLPNTS